jgi:hypothetical protein
MELIIFISVMLNTILSYLISESGRSRKIGGFNSFLVSFFFGFFIGVLLTIASPILTEISDEDSLEDSEKVSNFIRLSTVLLSFFLILSFIIKSKERSSQNTKMMECEHIDFKIPSPSPESLQNIKNEFKWELKNNDKKLSIRKNKNIEPIESEEERIKREKLIEELDRIPSPCDSRKDKDMDWESKMEKMSKIKISYNPN